MPFQYIGAPFIDGYALAAALNRLELTGVRFLPAYFTPALSVYTSELCGGVHIAVTDRRSFAPVAMAVSIFYALRRLYPDAFKITHAGRKYCGLNLLTGCAELTGSSRTAAEYFTRMENDVRTFKMLRKKYLLY